LFARAIIQSASCASVQLADAETLGPGTASALGCADEANAAVCLRGLTPTEILQAPARVYGPVVGGQFLPAAPYDVVRAGQQHPGPVLVGGLRDEMLGFAAVPPYYPLAAEDYPAMLAAWFPNAVEAIIERYPLSAYPEPFYALSTVFSDSGAFYGQALGGCVTDALTRALSTSTSTYAYELDDPNYLWPPGSVITRGASHASDLPFLFDIIGFSISQPFDARQNALADTMVRAWGAFVRSGNPATPERDWPAYDAVEQSMLHLVPGAVDITRDFSARHHCDFWRETLTPAAPAAGL
jgi:para-nitrobenzyl esterase